MTSLPPPELQALPRWVNWRIEERDGKPTKVPMIAGNGHRASTTDPTTWSSFDEAHGADSSKVGFVIHRPDGYVGVDLDGCRDPETGTASPWAQRIIDHLKSYTEVSPSGKGFHIWVKANPLPQDAPKKVGLKETGEIEMYSEARFFTVTGERVREAHPATIQCSG